MADLGVADDAGGERHLQVEQVAGAGARTLTAGNMVVWVILMLVGYLGAYFLAR